MKNIMVAGIVAGLLAFSTAAMAEVGFQFGVPVMATQNDSKLDAGSAGTSVMITLDLDQTLTVGFLNENMRGKEGGADYTSNLTGLRLHKTISDPFYIGVGLGNAVVTGAKTVNAPVADILMGGKFFPSKGKLSAYISAEVGYRMMKTNGAANAAVTDYSGIRTALAVGISF